MVAYKYTKSTFIGSGNELLNVTELVCSNCKITSFEGLNCPLLTTLYCSYTELTSFRYLNCPLLTKLYCGNNRLTSFQHLNCPRLTTLHCHNNQLTSLRHLNCPLLTWLSCSNNNLTSFEHLNCPLLSELWCSYNRLTSFEHLNCPLLTMLYCHHNQLTSFQHLNCPLLTTLVCSDNEWEFIPPHINRLLNALKNTQNVYTDRQNVHNHYIQESIRNSIQAVILQKPSIVAANIYEVILLDEVLTKETKEILVEYCKDPNVHSTLHITFEELLLHVFSRIESNANKQEIKSVLNMEMTDSVCKCFTGRMSRLINCLNGFDDLVSIKISDTEQIGQVIGQIKEQLETANEYTVEKHREMATEELQAREYSQEVIMEWIGFIE